MRFGRQLADHYLLTKAIVSKSEKQNGHLNKPKIGIATFK